MTALARGGGFCILLSLALAACAPALDWRDVHPAGSPLQMQFPCRPTAQQRAVPLGGAPVRLTLMACGAGGLTFGLGYADMADPARVQPALAELAASAAANVAGAVTQRAALQPRGATPNPASVRLWVQGLRPDGQPVQMALAVFVHGTTVYQATVLGDALPGEAVETFIASARFVP